MAANKLEWIDEGVLLDLVRKNFGKAVNKALGQNVQNKREPTLQIIYKVILGLDEKQIVEVNRAEGMTKTFQNAIGTFHQDVLGHAKGWRTTGVSGGLIDLKSEEKVHFTSGDLANESRYVLAELKMRFNTIKGSDQASVWDKLHNAVNSHGNKDYVAYLFQVVPKGQGGYDEPWKVSNRPSNKLVRVADGVTAYHLVTGDPRALENLLCNLPSLLIEAFPEALDKERCDLEDLEEFVLAACTAGLPKRSFFEEEIAGTFAAESSPVE
ncbi:Eco47II family restriction endonuclease [Corynebacterium sp. ES2730-CONJ]|uniref:Eco47II family restriction endonuclease n=1 Tax=Corynebacterium sp. ES2730-CONJ TaxID=2973941 RepID=UPI00216AC130|nr:Eco47II family restriction endonuclease [Corynebacterium sp. ES2730-CONJ]MCS4532156.1 Eco47II family restriction endonuclease [Corynebacterium sp. ES2730-CONJ]